MLFHANTASKLRIEFYFALHLVNGYALHSIFYQVVIPLALRHLFVGQWVV